jgi:glyoxylate reductase
MNFKSKVYLASSVFSPKNIGTNAKINLKYRNQLKVLWEKLEQISDLKIFNGRFPTQEELKQDISTFHPDIVGCHISHNINVDLIENSKIFAISTSTAGYNHIDYLAMDDILVTHTPGVLHETVADYTIALIMATLRNLIDLHNYVWDGNWALEDKWDLDQDLSSVLSNKILGIIGLGEIGTELVRKLYSWGIKILYYDIHRKDKIEKEYPNIIFKDKLEEIFTEADIVSLHLPLNNNTNNLIDRKFISLMKKDSLLVNTARGGVLNLIDLLDLLENKQIMINLALDVFPEEPIDVATLNRIKNLKFEQPDIRILLMPHNASADANTRCKMTILFLEDIIKLLESKRIEDLRDIHLIPEHRKNLKTKNWRIFNYWSRKGG